MLVVIQTNVSHKIIEAIKKYKNLFDKIVSMDNLILADEKARKGKTHTYGVRKHDKNRIENLRKLQKMLVEGTYVTSKYSTFKIYEPKERIIYRLPYYPDRIVHHAIMNVVEPIWVRQFISTTYSCIKGRGIHKCVKDVKKALKDVENTRYCLKFDIRKFYPSIDHDILKQVVRKKIGDRRLLNLLDGIIDSAEGVPIGNYLSQFFANLYLSDFDHYAKETLKARYYFRYADDIVILSSDKEELWNMLGSIRDYISLMRLDIKPDYQVFPIDYRGLDFVGYVFYHTHVLLRKSIKRNLFKTIFRYIEYIYSSLLKHLNSYFGWLKYCNSKNLLRKIENITGIHYSNWNGIFCKISDYYNKFIYIIHKHKYNKHYRISFIKNKQSYILYTRNGRLFNALKENKVIKICDYDLGLSSLS